MVDPLYSKFDPTSRDRDLQRIEKGLRSAQEIFRASRLDYQAPNKDSSLVSVLERAVDFHLQQFLPEARDGWLSEESTDNLARLEARRVWIVDPLDGTREFTAGIPEWSISIGLIEDGKPVAGGVLNPATQEMFLGAVESGVTLNGRPARTRNCRQIEESLVLASRSEVCRGEWKHLENAPFRITAMGSVAYKLARVAAGLADATWTLVPKHEWDVAAGVALVCASGGIVRAKEGGFPLFNRREPLFQGLISFSESCNRLFQTESSSFAGWLASSVRKSNAPLRIDGQP